MRKLVTKIKPASGFARFVHLLLNVLLPVLIYVLVRIDFAQIAVALIVLSKWRIFAVKPRHWLPNIRANGVDVIVGLSFISFMYYSERPLVQLSWAVIYGLWLILLKPRSDTISIGLQAMVAQLFGLIALYQAFIDAPLAVLVLVTWMVAYTSARHFLTAYDESATRAIANIWAFFAASLTWLLGHWLLYYGFLPQVVLLLSVISYGLGVLYYLHKTDRLSGGVQRQVIIMMCAILVVVIVFSDWKDKTI